MAPQGGGAKQRTLSDMILDKIRQAQQDSGLTEIPRWAAFGQQRSFANDAEFPRPRMSPNA